jgi:hypothetical protein
MPHRCQTRKILAVLAALAVVAMIAAVAYQLGHATTGPAPSSGTGTSSTAPPSGSSPSPAPASPSTGSSQPGLPQGPARAGEGGRMTGPAGLPLGYDHTETGAVQAATNYLTWMTSLRIKDKTTADALADATAADPATRAAMVESFDALRTGLEHVTEAETDPARGAYAVPSYDETDGSVYIWAPFAITESGVPTTAWGVSEIRLAWKGDWKLAGTLISRVGGAASEPANPTGNPTPAEKADILSRTPADPGEITDSAEQEWFEYANAAR